MLMVLGNSCSQLGNSLAKVTRNAGDFEKGVQATSKFIDWIANRYGTSDPAVIAAYYNGGGRAAYAVAHGKALPPGETNDYVRMMGGLTQPADVLSASAPV